LLLFFSGYPYALLIFKPIQEVFFVKMAVIFSLFLFFILYLSCNQIPTDPTDVTQNIDSDTKMEVLSRSTFIKHYGYSGNEYSVSVVKTHDGGYALSGKNDIDFYLVKTDRNGNLIWEKTFGNANTNENFSSVCQSDDGGYLLAGTDNNNWSVEVIKVDKNGTVQWQNNYEPLKSYSLVRIVPSHDDGYVGIAGNTVFKLGASGNLMWGRQYDSCAYFYSIERTADKGFIVAGASLIKITSQGEIQWEKKPDPLTHETYNHALQTRDGGYLVAGYKIIRYDEDAMEDVMEIVLLKTDSKGKYKWRKGYFPTYNYNFQYRIRETSDRQIAIVGFHDFKCTLIKVSPSGTFKWQKELSWNIFDGEFYDLVTTSDGGIVVTGTGNNQAALVKFDRYGNL
jgi:hypothetical protein